jgi:hypothetical protein
MVRAYKQANKAIWCNNSLVLEAMAMIMARVIVSLTMPRSIEASKSAVYKTPYTDSTSSLAFTLSVLFSSLKA